MGPGSGRALRRDKRVRDRRVHPAGRHRTLPRRSSASPSGRETPPEGGRLTGRYLPLHPGRRANGSEQNGVPVSVRHRQFSRAVDAGTVPVPGAGDERVRDHRPHARDSGRLPGDTGDHALSRSGSVRGVRRTALVPTTVRRACRPSRSTGARARSRRSRCPRRRGGTRRRRCRRSHAGAGW